MFGLESLKGLPTLRELDVLAREQALLEGGAELPDPPGVGDAIELKTALAEEASGEALE